jgi:hypothetical protein
MRVQSLHLIICLIIGTIIGISGIIYCMYIAIHGIGGGACGSSAFLFIFGLPTTLIDIAFDSIGIIKGTWSELIVLSVLFLINWILIVTLIGMIISKLFRTH